VIGAREKKVEKIAHDKKWKKDARKRVKKGD